LGPGNFEVTIGDQNLRVGLGEDGELRLLDGDGNPADRPGEYARIPAGLEVRIPVPGAREGTVATFWFNRGGRPLNEEWPLTGGPADARLDSLRVRRSMGQWRLARVGSAEFFSMSQIPVWQEGRRADYFLLTETDTGVVRHYDMQARLIRTQNPPTGDAEPHVQASLDGPAAEADVELWPEVFGPQHMFLRHHPDGGWQVVQLYSDDRVPLEERIREDWRVEELGGNRLALHPATVQEHVVFLGGSSAIGLRQATPADAIVVDAGTGLPSEHDGGPGPDDAGPDDPGPEAR
jgi:hypothetical protein